MQLTLIYLIYRPNVFITLLKLTLIYLMYIGPNVRVYNSVAIISHLFNVYAYNCLAYEKLYYNLHLFV